MVIGLVGVALWYVPLAKSSMRVLTQSLASLFKLKNSAKFDGDDKFYETSNISNVTIYSNTLTTPNTISVVQVLPFHPYNINT